MNDAWTYIQQNPLGAAVLCGAGAFLLATLSALVAALRGGAGTIFGEYKALGRTFADSRRAQDRQNADYAELRNRVAELSSPAKSPDSIEPPANGPTDQSL